MQVHIPLMIICILLCLLPTKGTFRERRIMPLCILLITIYMAIRYDYGLDYWSYYYAFTSDSHRTDLTEPLYWLFSSLFTKYYQLIAATTVALMATIFFWIKKYIPHQWYWLYILCFMCLPGMSWAMMTALRTVLAFVVLSWGIYNFYIKTNNFWMYLLSVVLAALFHNSAIVFALLPLLSKLILKVNPTVFFVSFIFFTLFSFTGIAQDISNSIFSAFLGVGIIDSDHYVHYATKYVSNFNGAIGRLPWMFPAYYICLYSTKIKDVIYHRFYVLSIIFFTLYFLSFDFESRFTLYLLTFVIIALTYCLTKMKPLDKVIAISPIIVSSIYQLFTYFKLMYSEQFGDYSDGNFFIYETIFDHLPLI